MSKDLIKLLIIVTTIQMLYWSYVILLRPTYYTYPTIIENGNLIIWKRGKVDALLPKFIKIISTKAESVWSSVDCPSEPNIGWLGK